MDDTSDLREYARSGSAEAFARLVQRYLNPVYTMCKRQLGDRHLAEDATQAVFLVLARRAGRIPPRVVLSGWLFQTARYACANIRRSEQRRRYHERQVVQMNRQARQSDWDWQELTPLLDDALASLRRPEREVMLLRYTQAMSVPQVGSELGLSEAAVRKRLSRAVGRLRQYFAGKGMVVAPTALGAWLETGAVEAAPAGLAQGVIAAGVGSAAPGAVSGAIAKGVIMAMKMHTVRVGLMAVVGSVLVVAAVTGAITHTLTQAAPAEAPATESAPLVPAAPAAVEPLADGLSEAQAAAEAGRWADAIDAYTRELRGLSVLQYRDKKDFDWILEAYQQREAQAGKIDYEPLAQIAREQLALRQGDELAVWRLHRLLAGIAEKSGDTTALQQQLELTVDAYPAQVAGDPSRHSSLQHLYNQVAMLQADQDIAAAEQYLLKRFREDPRFVYVFVLPWETWYEQNHAPQRLRNLVSQVSAAYRQKAQQQPELRPMLTAYAREFDAEVKRWEARQR